MEANSAIKQDKEKMEQKAAQLALDIVSSKARADEAEGQKAGIEEHVVSYRQQLSDKCKQINDLETQLAQR
jgi:chromosome segregation ATPase